jgi:hypothetical protein
VANKALIIDECGRGKSLDMRLFACEKIAVLVLFETE